MQKNKKFSIIVVVAIIMGYFCMTLYSQYDADNQAEKIARAYKDYYANNDKLPMATLNGDETKCLYDGKNLLVVTTGMMNKNGSAMINYANDDASTAEEIWTLMDLFKSTNIDTQNLNTNKIRYIYGSTVIDVKRNI